MKEEKTQEGMKIIDDSGDKKYFTIIPNCVINGSGVYERAMYLEMKRFAGETGECFASIRAMSKRLEVSHSTVITTIKKLLKRGWIVKIGQRATGSRPVNCYKIVDIWSSNSKVYKEKEKRKVTRE